MVIVFGLWTSQCLPLSHSALRDSHLDIGHALHLKQSLGGKDLVCDLLTLWAEVNLGF